MKQSALLMAAVTGKSDVAPERTEEPQLPTATGNDGAATEHTEEPQLAELLNQEAGMTSEIELKVIRNQIIEYPYKFEGTSMLTQKMQIVLQPKIPNQYCLGVARLQKNTKLS